MKVRPYAEADAEAWDALVRESVSGTFLHTRKFLSYHGSRFADRSLICEAAGGRMTALLPAALKPDDPACVASHPGATYAGLLYRQDTGPDELAEMLSGVVRHYRSEGLGRLEYKSVPPHLHSTILQTDVHALWKSGADLVRRDLWNVLSLSGPRTVYSSHHQRAIGRASKRGVVAGPDDTDAGYQAFHEMLAARLEDRYGVSPVHTPAEMAMLRDRFRGEIGLWLARDEMRDRVLAGCWVFMHAGKVWHTQYIAATPEGRECCATHLLFDRVIQAASAKGVGFLSFGCSTEDGGRRLNKGLFDFKAGFGAGAVCHDTFHLRLTS